MRISDWSSDVCSSDLRRSLSASGAAGFSPRCWCCPFMFRCLFSSSRRLAVRPPPLARVIREIGSASCRERVFQYVYISLVAVSLQNTVLYFIFLFLFIFFFCSYFSY